MKIIVTGSLGHISKPLTQELVQKGHSVTVISSQPERQKEIEALGATAAIGSVEDTEFLAATFAGAEAAYCMLPGRRNFTDPDFDIMEHANKVAHSYLQAIQQSGVKRIVYLSSIGAHTNKGNGILALHYNAENILQKLPVEVAITFMRPVGFYYNLYAFVNAIKTQDVMASNYGADDKVPWVSTLDIAAAVGEEITKSFTGRNIRYVASEEITCNQIAGILGTAIGMPDLKWIIITDEQLQSGMVAMGMNPTMAAGFVEMNAAQHSGVLFEDYYRHQPTLGKVKMVDFAKEFAAAFHQK
jgi:uncharacterized protein YbjT (DUF2867 family)